MTFFEVTEELMDHLFPISGLYAYRVREWEAKTSEELKERFKLPNDAREVKVRQLPQGFVRKSVLVQFLSDEVPEGHHQPIYELVDDEPKITHWEVGRDIVSPSGPWGLSPIEEALKLGGDDG